MPLILLAMILARLTWMQLREYPPVAEARTLLALTLLRTVPASPHCYDLDFEDLGLVDPTGTRSRGIDLRSEVWRQRQLEVARSYDRSHVLSPALAKAARTWLVGPGRLGLLAGACALDQGDVQLIVRFNQWLLGISVLLCVMLTRFVTSSWTVALIVSAMLLSRGRLLADLGLVSADWMMVAAVSGWFAALAHYLRSGSRLVLTGAIALLIVVTAVDLAGAALVVAPVGLLMLGWVFRERLARSVQKRTRKSEPRWHEGRKRFSAWPEAEVESFFGRWAARMRWMLGIEFADRPLASDGPVTSFKAGGLLRTLEQAFPLWVYHRRQWLVLAAVLSLGGLCAVAAHLVLVRWWGGEGMARILAALVGQDQGLMEYAAVWGKVAWQRVDLHLAASGLIILICAVQSPGASLRGFFEVAWLTAVTTLLLMGAALLLDWWDLPIMSELAIGERGFSWPAVVRPRLVLLWIEPVLLSLGVASVHNLMHVFDTRVAERR